MLRILHFADVINRYDFIDSVLTGLDRSRFEVAALTAVNPANRVGEYDSSQAYDSECLNVPVTYGAFPRLLRELKRKIREFRPHILQAHHYNESVIGAFAARLAGVPGFVVGHHYSDHIYVLTDGFKRRLVLQGESLVNRKADRIVVPSQEVADLLERQGENMAKVAVIPYGTDVDMLSSVDFDAVANIRNEFGMEDHFVALTACRLNREKGLDKVIMALPEVVKRFPSFRLFMAGTGDVEGSLKELVRTLDLEKIVTFIGWRTDTLEWIRASDLVIQPSISESFCQVLTESLVLERPVVMTPVGAAPDVIIPNLRGGYLVPVGDSRAIGNAIISAISNPEERKRLAAEGRKYVIENFSTQKTANRYGMLYEQVANEKGMQI